MGVWLYFGGFLDTKLLLSFLIFANSSSKF